MPVELNVYNQNRELEPGMFATVQWVITRPYETLFLPRTAVATDLKSTFIVRVRDGEAERVAVQQGEQMGNLVEVIGNIKAGDECVLKATDEIKNGSKISTKIASGQEIESAGQHTSAGGE
jgi:hypothetical protein